MYAETIAGCKPYLCDPVPGEGPILDVFIRGEVVFASRSDGRQPILYFADDGIWKRHEPSRIRSLIDSILDGATPLEVVTPND